MSERVHITVTVNGRAWTGEVAARTSLADFLRYELELTGTHLGCEHGVCGACTVIVDGEAVRSCLMLAVQADGHAVATVESLAEGDALSGFQRAMMEEHGLQCGFCTPGILMTVAAAEAAGTPAEEVSTELLDGHICRCTGYVGIRAAIRAHWSRTGGAHIAAHAGHRNGTSPNGSAPPSV